MKAGVVAIVPSAGRGRRFGGEKVLAPLKGRAVIAWTLQALQQVQAVKEIIPVVSPAIMERVLHLIESESITKVRKVVPGGRERFHSVKNGFDSIEDSPDIVLIHDGVRPLADPAFISFLIESLQDYDGVVPGITPVDTIKIRDNDTVKTTPDRRLLVAVQTPQVFRYDVLKKAYMSTKGREQFTDDAQMVEVAGGRIRIVEGIRKNIKITTPEDLLLAEILVQTERQEKPDRTSYQP